ncbi:MAG: preprotein translocase subunit SecY [Planctomycetia bacterium]|nr:preprotein translocase subunit SecY [Planctomycetia bacterium]
MFEKIRVIFTIPELRRKIFLTLLLLAIFRVGYQINLPMVNPDEIQIGDASGTNDALQALLNQAAIFSASDIRQITIFGLGIMPYISASIIFQLLASVWAPLEKLQKEGESGRKKINEYTRYATIGLCIFQSWFYLLAMPTIFGSSKIFLDGFCDPGTGHLYFQWQIIAVFIMTCGTAFLMWLGEQIDAYGIGNGISLLIMAGILARMPLPVIQLYKNFHDAGGLSGMKISGGDASLVNLMMLAALFFAVVTGVVFITLGQRRIPSQSAKHVRGRRVMGGMRQYLPIKVNQAGVMPIIFASSLLMIPAWLFNSFRMNGGWFGSICGTIGDAFSRESMFTYNFCYIVLIYFFCYFWTAITFNPKDMAENLKRNGTIIRGHRPGKRTADYLEKVMTHITYVGAGFLAIVAILPHILSSAMHIDYNLASFYGGTSLLIAVSVAFDLVQKIDSHLVMVNHKGLLEK